MVVIILIKFNTLKIQTQLIMFNSATMLVLIIIIFTTYLQSVNIINENNSRYINQSIYQIDQELITKCNTLEKITYGVAYNDLIQEFINNKEPVDVFENSLKLSNFLASQIAINDSIIDICILPNEGSAFDLLGVKDKLGQLVDKTDVKKRINYSEMKRININDQYFNCLLMTVTVFYSGTGDNYGMPIGKVILVINAEKMSQYVVNSNQTPGTEIYLTDKKNVIYCSNNRNMVGEKIPNVISDLKLEEYNNSIINTGEFTVHIQDYSRYKGKIISVNHKDTFMRQIRNIRKMDLILFIGCIIILSVPFSLILKNIINPIKKISKFMNEVKNGNLKNLKGNISLNGHAEVITMADDFNGMLNEIDTLTHRLIDTNTLLYEAEINKKQAELAFLQSQINPHFLYNTLESIKGIALSKRVPEIRDIAQSLADIFRYSIKGEDMVLLEEELSIFKSYLKIQEIRFFGRFETEFCISQDTCKLKVPKMILQPIAENAIYHGLELKSEFGHLKVSTEITVDNSLKIIIEDDGVGIPDNILKELREALNTNTCRLKTMNIDKSIGLINVNNRIKLKYGDGFGISLESIPNLGTKVILTILAKEVNDV